MMNMLKVGDLISDNDHGEIGLIVEVGADRSDTWISYRVLYIEYDGRRTIEWFSKDHVETDCEVLS